MRQPSTSHILDYADFKDTYVTLQWYIYTNMDCSYSIAILLQNNLEIQYFQHTKGNDVAELIAFLITWQISENGDATEARISGKQIATYG